VKLRRGGWLVVAALVLWAGCRALPPAPPPAAPLSREDLVARLRAREQQIKSFQAKGRVTFLSPQQNYSGTALLTAQLPDRLKVDVLDFLGRTVLQFATDGQEVQVLSVRENKLLRGPATAGNLAVFIPPTVSLPQALRLLVGALPLSSGPAERFESQAANGRDLLEWSRDGRLTERLWVEVPGLNPVADEWFGGTPQPRFSAELDNFGALVPHVPEKITLKTITPKIELRLVYQDFKPNPSLSPADLTLAVPAGVAVVPLGK
jgi:hypothetical protein